MRLILLTFCLIIYSIIWSQYDEMTVIYLIRHSEKVENSKDPELSDKGKLRVENWVKYFDKIQLESFYSTATNRTFSTCSTIAKNKQKEVQTYDYKSFSINEILTKDRGKSILIVGHSNTIPILINTFLGKEIYPNIPENEYGNLYIITIQGDQITHELKYINN